MSEVAYCDTFRSVVADAMGYLDGKHKKQAEFRPQAYGTDGPKR